MVGGDFNIILDESKKLGGLQVTQQEMVDFAAYVNVCSLSELKFYGSSYTLWNGQIEEDCIFKRLDRVLVNYEFFQILSDSEVHHFIKQGSDHVPLHVLCDASQDQIVKPFKFVNFWAKHEDFQIEVK